MTPASRPVLALLIGLALLPGSAFAVQAAVAPVAPDEVAVEEPGVTWPSPWVKADTRLVYDVKSVAERQRGEAATTLTTQSVQTITPDAAASGKSQAWTETTITFDFSDGFPPEQQALMIALAKSFDGRPAIVQLNDEGNVTGLANTADLLPLYQDALRRMGEESVRRSLAEFTDPAERAEAEKVLRAGTERLMATMGSEPALVSSILKIPAAYNFPGRGGMVAGESYAYEEQAPNPYGGDAFPMIGEFELKPPAADASELELTWTLRMHPTKAPPVMWALVEKMTGQPIDPEVRKGLPDSVDFSYRTLYRIDRSTGVVTWMERTEIRKITGVLDRTVTTMTLRDGG